MCATFWPPTCARDTAVANCPARQQRQRRLLGGETSFLSWSFSSLSLEGVSGMRIEWSSTATSSAPGSEASPHLCQYVCDRMPPQLRHTSLRLWFGSPRRHIRRHYVRFGCPHSYITHHYFWYGSLHSHVRPHYICDTGIPTATSDVTTSVILASLEATSYVATSNDTTSVIWVPPQPRHYVWYGRSHRYVTRHYVWYARRNGYIMRHFVCDSGVPRATSYVSVSLIQASPQLRHTSLCLWFGCPRSHIRPHYVCDLGVPTATLDVTLCDSGVPTATSDVTTSVIQMSPQLHQMWLCLWFGRPHSYIIGLC